MPRAAGGGGALAAVSNEVERCSPPFDEEKPLVRVIGPMRAVGESGDGHADVPPAHMGAIDKTSVAVLVEEILEGGKDAFQTRRQKYGF